MALWKTSTGIRDLPRFRSLVGCSVTAGAPSPLRTRHRIAVVTWRRNYWFASGAQIVAAPTSHVLVSRFQACYRHRRRKALRGSALATYRIPKTVVLSTGYVKPEFSDYKVYGVGHKSLVNGQPSSPSRCGQRTTCGRHSWSFDRWWLREEYSSRSCIQLARRG